jgi:GcrA cell cycle regulator
MTSWTPQEVARMTSLLKDGHSYGEISEALHKELGVRYSRNACIGKAARLGLEAPAKASKPRRLPRPPATREPPKPRTVAAGRPSRAKVTQRSGVGAFVLPSFANTPGNPQENAAQAARANAAAKAAALASAANMNPEPPGRRTMQTLCAHECKWPIGEPQSASFSFCGARHDLAGPYCETHSHKAYQPGSVRRRVDERIGITRATGARA